MAFQTQSYFLRTRVGLHLTRHFSQPSAGVPYVPLKSDDVKPPSTVPTSADAVIIGGGIIGCSTLYHLAKLGIRDTVLLEKDQITAGTTWHTAGLVWRLRPNDTDIVLLNHTRHLLHHVLEEETGVHSGWINNGGLFIANSKERLEEYKRLMTIGKAFGIESHVLSPEETKNLYPLMNVSDLYGTLYSPGDGTVEPSGFCLGLKRSATKAGAKVVEKCKVTGIEVAQDDFGIPRIKGVVTNAGKISTSCVINCTGVWAPYVGKMAGVKVPLIPMKHAYVVTNKIEGIQNMPNARDHDLSIYMRLQGDALSIGGYEPNPEFVDQVPEDFAFSLYELNWDVFGTHIESAIHRLPVLENVGIKSTVCGPESFTPDHKPLLGEDPEVRGFYHGCGFNSLGMNAGGGCGRELARWVAMGRPQLDMYAYDIRRFSSKLTDNLRWIRERSHESYAKNYTIVYPHDEPLAGRNMIKDPMHEDMLKAGCVFQERLGWERPGWFEPSGTYPVKDYDYYGSYGHARHENYGYEEKLKQDYSFNFPKHHNLIKEECLGCRTNVAIFNMSYFGKFYLTGPDAQAACDWIFTNNIQRSPGSTIYTCMLNKRGGVEADLTVSVLEPGEGDACDPTFEGRGFYIAASGALAQHNITHIRQVIQDKKFNVHLTDRSEDMGLLSVQGPKSRELLQSLTESDLDDDKFPFSTHKIITLAGHKVRALRLTFVGELGWELHVPRESCVPVYRAIMSAGSRYHLVNAGYRALDSLSCEKGYKHWHADLRMDDSPLEAGLGFTCKLRGDTPFLGREALEKAQERGPKKRLVGFTVPQGVVLWGLETIYRNDRLAGFIRRAEYSFSLGRTVAWGYVADSAGEPVATPAWAREGVYRLESRGLLFPAAVHIRAPFDPHHRRVRGDYTDPLPSSHD